MNRSRSLLCLAICLSLCLCLASLAWAQTSTATAATTASALPRLVRFGGVAKDLNGNPLNGVVGITFALYGEQTGGTPLWLETQNVTADSNGHYTAVLGSTKPDGLPVELFTSVEARWVGVQVSGQAEQPRVLLVSAPYAFKAGDAETIGGLPPSAFVLAPTASGSSSAARASGNAKSAGKQFTSSGSANFIPLFTDNSGDLGNSALFQSTSGSTAGYVGIGTTTPAATLDVTGTGSINAGTIFAPAINGVNVNASFQVTGLEIVAAEGPTFGFYIGSNLFAFGEGSSGNSFLGFAGNPSGIIIGTDNTATGSGALTLGLGNLNTANGYQALGKGTTGNNNTAIGAQSLYKNTGNNNTASGYQSLFTNTTGIDNAAVGYEALYANTQGNNNAATGYESLRNNTTGRNNTASGYSSLINNTMGSYNSGFGYHAGPDTSTPNLTNATAIGAYADVTTSNSLVLGSINGKNGAPSNTNVGIGTTAPLFSLDVHGNANFTGAVTFNSPVTFEAGQTFPNTISGVTTASSSGLTGGGTTGNLNLSLINTCSIGQVLAWNGAGAGGGWVCSTVSGGSGGITGSGTLNSLPFFNGVTSLASSNIFQGSAPSNYIGINQPSPAATLDVNGTLNVANAFNLGGIPFAFGSSTNGNAFLGFAGNSTTTGNQNTAIGQSSLLSDSTGYSNTAVGYALSANTTGNYNAGFGVNTLLNNTTGSFYTAVGSFAGQVLDASAGTGINDTAVGSGAGFGTGNLTNATALGSNAEVTESNALVLGAITGLNGGTSVNVGIGTSAPLYTLDVHGTGNFTGLVTFNSSQNFPNTVSAVTVSGGGLVETGTGSVNLSLAPCAVGQVLAESILGWACSTVSSGGGGITGSGTVNSLPLFNGSTSLTSSNVFQGLTGNIGIGTATPQATLDVNGAINAATSFNLPVGGGSTPFVSAPGGLGAYLNTAVGGAALISWQAGNNSAANTAVGYGSLSNDTQGGGNTAVGLYALHGNTSGNNNTAVGIDALQAAGSGINNTALGVEAGPQGAPGINNATAIGAYADVEQSNSLVLGSILNTNSCTATNTCATTSVGIGTTTPKATFDVESPSGNPPPTVIFGSASNPAVFTVNGSLSVTGAVTCGSGCGGGGGSGTVTSVATGLGLTGGPITGSGTLSINTSVVPQLTANNGFTGNNTFTGTNQFTGYTTAASISATSLTTTGAISGGNIYGTALYLFGNTTNPFAYSSSSGNNAFLGFAGEFTSKSSPGDFNTAVGFGALNNNGGGGGFSVSSNNTAIGASALLSNTTGGLNTASGSDALYNNTTGSNNTAVGYNAGSPSVYEDTTGSNNTFLGASSGPGTQPALNYATAIGANAVVSQPNSLVLGSIVNMNGCTSPCTSTSVGIGTAAPQATLDVEAPSGTPPPTVNFGSASNPASFTVNGTATIAGSGNALFFPDGSKQTTAYTGGGGGGGGITSVTGTNGVNASTIGGNVTLSLNTAATNTFTGTQTFNVTTGNGIVAQTAGNSNAGISGSNTSTLGPGAGVAGFTVSGSGSGVVGTNSSSSLGGGYGVQGLSYNSADPGVGGINNSPAAGGVYGVFGQSLGSTGTGVYGTGNGSGVTGNAMSPAGSGVVGTNFSTSGNAYGLYGQSSSPTGTGVFGTGNGSGVTGSTSSPTGTGVIGVNTGGGYAGYFQGNVAVTNNASVTGTLTIGGDKPLSHSPRMTFSGTVANFTTSQFQPAGYLIPDEPIVITRFTVAVGNADNALCFYMSEMGFISGSQQLFLGVGFSSGYYDSGPLTVSIAAGAPIQIVGLEASGGIGGCESGGNMTATVQYAMQ